MTLSRDLPLDKAGVISTVVEGILYGFSVFMFIGTIWVLFSGRRGRDVNWIMVVVACLLFVFSTSHIITDIIRVEHGLVKYRDTYPGGPVAFFSVVSERTFVIKNIIYTLQTLLGDGVVVYRCHTVWRSPTITIITLIGWCGVVVTSVGSTYSISQPSPQSDNIFYKTTGDWITSFYASTFGVNLISTGLLAYRIWSINKNVSGMQLKNQSSLLPAILTIIDAGCLYSVTLLAALFCFVSKSNGQYVVLDMVCPIISIAFYMIIIRVGFNRTKITSQKNYTNPTMDPHYTSSVGSQSQQYGMRPLQVHITQLAETKTDTDDENMHTLSKPRSEDSV